MLDEMLDAFDQCLTKLNELYTSGSMRKTLETLCRKSVLKFEKLPTSAGTKRFINNVSLFFL